MTVPLESIKKIYNHLGDELSKTIFENRLLYSLTDNYKFIETIVAAIFKSDEDIAARAKFERNVNALYSPRGGGDGFSHIWCKFLRKKGCLLLG